MVHSKLGLKAVGLCALVLGLMAFTASAAQAEKGAAWMVNGSNISGTLLPELKVKEIEELKVAPVGKHLVLLTKILGILTHILCGKAELIGVKLGSEGSVSKGKVNFEACATFLAGSATASAPCLPSSGGVKDAIVTKEGVGLLVLVGGVGETLIKAAETGPLAIVESTEECAVGQKIKIEGELIIKDCQGKIKEELVDHLIEADNVASTLTAAGQPATIDGSVIVALKGAHENLKWSGLPA